jgi:MtN3 and saliva related transmembrane protein
MIETLGFVAGALTTISFAPQALKTWRTRRCDDLSSTMLLTFAGGVVLWLVYGLAMHAPPIIAANSVTLVLIAVIMVMKLRFRGQRKAGSKA